MAKKQDTQPKKMKVIVVPLPLPDDIYDRLAKIYALALQRWYEHHGSWDSAGEKK